MTTHDALAERARQGWIGSEAADELADTLDLVAELEELGALSPAQAQDIIEGLAQEQAEIWLDEHALPRTGTC